MRRKDREVLDMNEIFDILDRCDTIRIGLHGDKYPYVVPVSFGAELVNGKPLIYFHCARQGMKLELLRQNACVCVEGDIFIKTETTDHGITTRYESVIGFGNCQLLSDESEVIHALRLLTEHYGYHDYSLDGCGGIPHLYVGKIEIEEMTGKRNLPGISTAADMER